MAPINLPDGTEVSEVILPDGASASEVIAPDGSTVFAGIPDSGTLFYEIGGGSNNLHEFDASTAFDVSTLTLATTINTDDAAPTDLAWNTDGSKLYELGESNVEIIEYTVSEPFDISTASVNQRADISSNVTAPKAIGFNSNGTKVFISGNVGNGFIHEHELSTAFDVSTLSFVQSFDTNGGSPVGLAWNGDGTTLYDCDNADDQIHEYGLSTAFDVSTASLTQSVAAQASDPQEITWNDDGTKLYELQRSNSNIHEFSASTAFDISTLSGPTTVNSQDGSPTGIVWNGVPQYA